ncbi:MAG: BREX-1 system phosphatase PglZ type B [Pyrinomonadaceae bacterium]
MLIIEQIIAAVRSAATYNSHELAAPSVILWPDQEGLWIDCIDELRAACPELLSLGTYDPERSEGPGVWLRYRVDGAHDSQVPILYLPDVGRSAFRSADQVPDVAKNLFGLQYRGQFWTQKNGKDWTPFAFLSSSEGGLGLDVASDQKTKVAIQECLKALLTAEVDSLKYGRLEAADFRALVTKDPARKILLWMSEPSKTQASDAEWKNLCEVCRDAYGFDPEKDGAITAAERLSDNSEPWKAVWERYKESPASYPGVKTLLESIPPKDLFEEPSEFRPVSNQKEESSLESALLALADTARSEVVKKLGELNTQHSHRSRWVWAALGEAPLAIAVGHLNDAAEMIRATANHPSWTSLADYYANEGWKVDQSVIRAINIARSLSSSKAVAAAIRALYLPWLERLAENAQSIEQEYPNIKPEMCRVFSPESGKVYVFADGLRMDLAKVLQKLLLTRAGMDASVEHSWTALPSVTSTAKSAWRPLAEKLGGPFTAGDFDVKTKADGKPVTQERFKKLIADVGIEYMPADSTGDPSACSWTECANFDSYGHAQGSKLAWRIDEELQGLSDRIQELLNAGWKKVQIVTDHGFLMMPGGLPKVDLPQHLTTSRWGRCANPDAGAKHGYKEIGWFWDAAEAVVLAPSIACFKAGVEYSHGGLTVQEALIPTVIISGRGAPGKSVSLKEYAWSGLRLNMIFEGADGMTVDLRSKVGDPASSYVISTVQASSDGSRTSLLVEDDGAIGSAAHLVVLDASGQPIFRDTVVIGEN